MLPPFASILMNVYFPLQEFSKASAESQSETRHQLAQEAGLREKAEERLKVQEESLSRLQADNEALRKKVHDQELAIQVKALELQKVVSELEKIKKFIHNLAVAVFGESSPSLYFASLLCLLRCSYPSSPSCQVRLKE